MSEFNLSSGEYPYPDSGVIIDGLSDYPGQSDETAEPDEERDPSVLHPQRYKMVNGVFREIKIDNDGKEQYGFELIDFGEDGNNAIKQAIEDGMGTFISTGNKRNDDGSESPLRSELTIILVGMDGDSPLIEISSVELPPDEEEDEDNEPENTEIDSNTDRAESQQSDNDDGEINPKNDEEYSRLGEQSKKDNSENEHRVTNVEEEGNLGAEAVAKLAEEEKARKAVVDALDRFANNTQSPAVLIELSVGSGENSVEQTSPEPVPTNASEASHPTDSDVLPAPAELPVRTTESSVHQVPVVASQDDRVKPVAAPASELASASSDSSSVEQVTDSSEAIQQTHKNNLLPETLQELSELVERPRQSVEIESEAITPLTPSDELDNNEITSLVADKQPSPEATNEPEIPTKLSQLLEPVMNQFEEELILSTITKEQVPAIIEVREFIEDTTPKLESEIKTADKVAESVTKQGEQLSTAIRTADEGKQDIIYSRKDAEQTAPDAITKPAVMPKKQELTSAIPTETPMAPPYSLDATAPIPRRREAVRFTEPIINQSSKNTAESSQPRVVKVPTNELPIQKESEVLLTIDTPPNEKIVMGVVERTEAITVAGMRKAILSRKKDTENDSQPSLTITPNKRELLRTPNPNPGVTGATNSVVFDTEGNFTVFADQPDSSKRRPITARSLAAEVEPELVGMVG